MKKFAKKILSYTLALTAMLGSAATLSACETDHPEVEMVLQYEGKNYTLKYILDRKATPATIAHFFKLVENNYYDGLCVHDYDKESKMYLGGYSYDVNATSESKLVYKNYYDVVKSYENFPTSVWSDKDKTTALYTLRGEFSDNGVKIGDKNNSGALKEDFGALTMYYSAKSGENEVAVYNTSTKKMQKANYEYNSATSLFAMNLSDSSSVNNKYCTFANLDEDSVETLEKLIALVDKDEDNTVEYTLDIDRDDAFVKDSDPTATYNVLQSPIVIKSVKVVKY